MATLTDKQKEAIRLLGGPQRHSELVGGGRSGKTVAFVRAIIVRAVRAPGSRHVIFRLRYNAIRRSIWLDTLPKVLKLFFPGLPVDWHEADGYITLPNGAEIWISGLDDKERVERILGMEFVTIYFNECSQIPYASVLMALTRLSQKCPEIRARAYYDLNPIGKGHWTYKLFIEQKNPESLQRLPDPDNYVHLFMNPVDNRENIDEEYIKSFEGMPARVRARFLEGIYIEQYDGQLWTLEGLDEDRVDIQDVPPLKRIYIAVDPSGAKGEFDVTADEIGIGVCGEGDPPIGWQGVAKGRHGYFLEDLTGLYSPEQWGKIAATAYHKWKADKIVAEKNYGGDMVRAVIHAADPNVAVELVDASRGKVIRAEPIAAIGEQHRLHNVGRFPLLEDELTNFTTAGYMGGRSPNRADAYIWGFTKLFPAAPSYGLFGLWREQAEKIKDKNDPKAPITVASILKAPDTLADAQKEAGGWMETIGKMSKIAKTTTLAPPCDICPNCGNDSPSMFAEAWKCGACGASGRLVDRHIPQVQST